jgi:hypothetical protein
MMLAVTLMMVFCVFTFQAKVYFHFQYMSIIEKGSLQFKDAVLMMLPVFVNPKSFNGSQEAAINARNTKYCLYAFWFFTLMTILCSVLLTQSK